ncbi:glycerate kinase [Halomonas sp. 18H]|uniref:glycerate kinase type-2 family protein n=1 Tax=Halomonas almeriensis TaxID=308163 RepID=UPI002231E033|nr:MULTISPECIES: glycerate kinase [Halomonas]MCW4152707.1 glycerate kinase [Halomonas sp. 18H]MDN3552088.1 glycerate kinase [Halomonas almeriensis]
MTENTLPLDPGDPERVRRWLIQLSETAVAAVHPQSLVFDALPEPPAGRTLVVGAGKAAAAMATALERAWQAHCPEAPLSGLVVTRYGHGPQGGADACTHIEVLEASHPMPDDLGERAARRMLDALEGVGKDDRVIALISGGGSALMTLPAAGIELAEKQALNKALLRCGAPISQINTVRRHLSAIKGGRLAVAAHPAPVLTWLISDVPGDDPSLIASGPTLPDASTPADALAILEQHGIAISPAVRYHLNSAGDAPRAEDAEFRRDRQQVLARARDALEAARQSAVAEGIAVQWLGDDLEGEARELGRTQAKLAFDAQRDASRPCLLLSGGETSVTLQGDGRGGRNVEYLLGLFSALKGAPGIHALAIDTDGIDGSEDNAGAIFGPGCWQARERLDLDPDDYLSRNDAYTFFAALGDLIVTGPTRTNVNDFRAILVLPRTS